MKTKELINEKLFEQFERDGKEVIYTHQKGKKIRAKVIDPVEKLFQKGCISREEVDTANDYSIDFEFSNCENYAQAVMSGLPAGTTEFCFEDRRLQASKRVDDVKMLVKHIANYRQRKLKKKLAENGKYDSLTSNEKVLIYIFEKRRSVRSCEARFGINYSLIEKKCTHISKIIFNYYEN